MVKRGGAYLFLKSGAYLFLYPKRGGGGIVERLKREGG